MKPGTFILIGVLISFVQNAYCQENPYAAVIESEVLKMINQPVLISRSNGSSFEGYFEQLREDGIRLSRVTSDGGEIIVSFEWGEVDEITFGEASFWGAIKDLYESGDYQSTIRLMKPLYEFQSVYFEGMKEFQLSRYLWFISSLLETGSAAEALGVLRGVKEHFETKDLRQVTEDLELFIYLELDLKEEALVLAKSRIESAKDPSEGSLAWVALALYHLENQSYREAWLAAVHPILFDRRMNSPDLPDAYVLAMIAAIELNQGKAAFRYFDQYAALERTKPSKTYMEKWEKTWNDIEWERLREDPQEMEALRALQKKIQENHVIDATKIPLLYIPILKN